jgi:hypothetical protein
MLPGEFPKRFPGGNERNERIERPTSTKGAIKDSPVLSKLEA